MYYNIRLEQDHRSIKQRYSPMRGFGRFALTSRFCRAFDELRQFFRYRTIGAPSSTTSDVLPTSGSPPRDVPDGIQLETLDGKKCQVEALSGYSEA